MHSCSQGAEAHLRLLCWFVHQRKNQRQHTRQSTPSSWNCDSRMQTQIATSIAGQTWLGWAQNSVAVLKF
jgi:hypothetical protein